MAMPTHLVEDCLIHVPLRLRTSGLPGHAEEVLFKRNGPERCVEEEETLVPIYAKEVADIDVIRQRCTQADNANEGLTRLHLRHQLVLAAIWAATDLA